MNWGDAGGWATVSALVIEVVAVMWGVLRHFSKIERRLERIELEYKPNHGSSMRDAVNRIETKIAKLEGRFEQHVEETE
jgi:hypothetical protein